jgi:hypothetical protein
MPPTTWRRASRQRTATWPPDRAPSATCFARQRVRAITLSDDDRRLIAAMLHSSDDAAADTLWTRYGGADHQANNNDFPAYGMTGLRPPRGYSTGCPYWGFQKATLDDLDRLINYNRPAARTLDR